MDRNPTLAALIFSASAGCAAGQQRTTELPLRVAIEQVSMSPERDCAEIALRISRGQEGLFLLDARELPIVSLVSTQPPQDHIRLSYSSFEYYQTVLGPRLLDLVAIPRGGLRLVINIPMPLTPAYHPDRIEPRPFVKHANRISLPVYLRVAVAWIPRTSLSDGQLGSGTIERGKALILQRVIETDDLLLDESVPTSEKVHCQNQSSSSVDRPVISTQRFVADTVR